VWVSKTFPHISHFNLLGSNVRTGSSRIGDSDSAEWTDRGFILACLGLAIKISIVTNGESFTYSFAYAELLTKGQV